MLSNEEKLLLLNTARQAIASELLRVKPQEKTKFPSSLLEPMGAFVTLRKHGELRGCIGFIEAEEPLVYTVQEAAMRSAFHDPRFPPLTKAELNEIEIEISVMSPKKIVTDFGKIMIGEHGLIVESKYKRGLLLPQVAGEFGWDRPTFIEQTCRKAGLPPHAWQSADTKIYSFTAEIFTESEFNNSPNHE